MCSIVEMENYNEANRKEIEQQIISCLALLDVQKLLRVICYITRIWK